MTDEQKPRVSERQRRLSRSATRRLIMFLAALAIGISIWATFAIYQGRDDPELQRQLQDIRESLDPDAVPRPPAN